jgi:hypothetical protein
VVQVVRGFIARSRRAGAQHGERGRGAGAVLRALLCGERAGGRGGGGVARAWLRGGGLRLARRVRGSAGRGTWRPRLHVARHVAAPVSFVRRFCFLGGGRRGRSQLSVVSLKAFCG